jgi:hypothetical protein
MSLNPYEPPRTLPLDRTKQLKPAFSWTPFKPGIISIVAILLGAAILFQLVTIAAPFVDNQLLPGWPIVFVSSAVAGSIATWFGFCTHRSRQWDRWVQAQIFLILILLLGSSLLLPAKNLPRSPARGNLKQGWPPNSSPASRREEPESQ